MARKIESRVTPAFKFVQKPKRWESVEENVVEKYTPKAATE